MPDARHAQPFHRRQLVRMALAAGATAFAGGFIASHAMETAVLDWVPRVAVVVASVTLVLWITEIRLARQMARLETGLLSHLAAIERRLDERLGKAVYAEGYVDGIQRIMPEQQRHLRSVP